MGKEPLEAKDVQHLTLDQLFELSLDELRKSLGVPKVIEADKTRRLNTCVTNRPKVAQETCVP